MGTLSRYIKFLLIFMCISAPAKAQEPLPPLDFSGHYDFTLAAIPFGQLDIVLSQGPGHYRATSDIATTGVAKVFVQHQSHTVSRGTGANYRYTEVEYETNYETKGKKRSARFVKRNGEMVEDDVEPADSRATRPAVPLADKSAAWDPVSLALGMRIELARVIAQKGKDFSLTYYDGRRLTRGNFSYIGEKVIKIKGIKYPVYTVIGSRQPVAGFTQKELKRMEGGEPQLTVYFSKDKLIPIRLELNIGFGVAAATLKM